MLGYPNLGEVRIGAVSVTGACTDSSTVTFSGATATLLNGVLTGSNLGGTVDKQKTCFTGGTFNARADLALPPLSVATPLCVGYDSSFNPEQALANLFRAPEIPSPAALPAPSSSFPTELGPLCPGSGTGSLKGRLLWSGAFPAIPLGNGFTVRDGIVDFTCDRVRIGAQVAVAGAAVTSATSGAVFAPAPGTITFLGTGRTDNSFEATIAFQDVPILASPVTFIGTVTGNAAGGPLTYDVVARLANQSFGIPGFNLRSGEARFTNTGTSVAAKAMAGAGELALSLFGTYQAENDWSLTVSADSTDPKGSGTWKPAASLLPTFDVPRGTFRGNLRRVAGAPVEFDIQTALGAPVSVVADRAIVTGASVRISNGAVSEGCPVPAGQAWIELRGTGRLTVPDAPIVDLAASACLGLGGGQFRLATTADFNSWKPRADVDLTVEGFGFEVTSANGALFIAGNGELRFQGARGLARVEFRSPNILIVDGGVSFGDLGLGGGTGHVILATQPVANYSNPVDPALGLVNLVPGVTAVTSINLDAATRTFLVQKLGVPAGSVPERLQAKAQLGGASVLLQAELQFPTPGLQLLETCPQNRPCTADTRTSMHLRSVFFRVESTGSVGLGASVRLHLPKPDPTRGSASDVELTGTFTVTPPATLGVALSMTGTLNDALGIQGLGLKDLAVQGALDFSASGVPVPVRMGVTATVTNVPNFLSEPLGIVGNEPMSFALNVAPEAPVFSITLGTANGTTFLKPLTMIDNGRFANELTVDFAQLHLAPLGGRIGEVQIPAGMNVQFDGTVAGTAVRAKAQLDPTTLTLTGKFFVDTFELSGMTVDQTDLSLLIQPTKFDMTIKGGFIIPGGPRASIDGHLLVQAAATDPIRLDLTATAASWQVDSANKLTSVKFEIHGALASLATPPNLAVSLTANGTVLGTGLTFGGGAVVDDGQIRFLALQVNPASFAIASTTIAGTGCQNVIAPPSGITLATLPGTSTTGACVQLRYATSTNGALDVSMRINGSLTSAGIVTTFSGVVGTDGLAIEDGSARLPNGETVTVNGTIVARDGALNVVKVDVGGNELTVAGKRGDFSLSGTWSPAAPLAGSSLNLRVGFVGGVSGLAFGRAAGVVVVSGSPLGNATVVFSSTGGLLSVTVPVPLPALPGCATLSPAGPLNATVTGALTANEIVLTGVIAPPATSPCSGAPTVEARVESRKNTLGVTTFLLRGTARNWTFGPTKVDELSSTISAANATTATVATRITAFGRTVELAGTAALVSSKLQGFILSASTSPVTLGLTTLTGIASRPCGTGSSLGGPCFSVDLNEVRPAADRVRVTFASAVTASGLNAELIGAVGDGQVLVEGRLDAGQFGFVDVVGSLFTATPVSRAATVTGADGRIYNLGAISTAVGTSINSAAVGDFVLAAKVATPRAGRIANFEANNLIFDAGRIGANQWVRASGRVKVGDATGAEIEVCGLIAKSGTSSVTTCLGKPTSADAGTAVNLQSLTALNRSAIPVNGLAIANAPAFTGVLSPIVSSATKKNPVTGVSSRFSLVPLAKLTPITELSSDPRFVLATSGIGAPTLTTMNLTAVKFTPTVTALLPGQFVTLDSTVVVPAATGTSVTYAFSGTGNITIAGTQFASAKVFLNTSKASARGTAVLPSGIGSVVLQGDLSYPTSSSSLQYLLKGSATLNDPFSQFGASTSSSFKGNFTLNNAGFAMEALFTSSFIDAKLTGSVTPAGICIDGSTSLNSVSSSLTVKYCTTGPIEERGLYAKAKVGDFNFSGLLSANGFALQSSVTQPAKTVQSVIVDPFGNPVLIVGATFDYALTGRLSNSAFSVTGSGTAVGFWRWPDQSAKNTIGTANIDVDTSKGRACAFFAVSNERAQLCTR